MNKHIKKYSISLFIREIQIKITITTTTHPLDELNSKRLTIPSVNKDVKKLNSSYTDVGNAKYIATLENISAVPQMVKHRAII